jgi:hypothetical protein
LLPHFQGPATISTFPFDFTHAQIFPLELGVHGAELSPAMLTAGTTMIAKSALIPPIVRIEIPPSATLGKRWANFHGQNFARMVRISTRRRARRGP